MHSFDFRGLPVRYVRQGRGEPLVLIHNGGTSHAIWKAVLPALTDRFEVFSLDLPGFGASPSPEGGYGLSDYIDLLAAFVDAHCTVPVRMVGNCMGSAIALGLAMRRPRGVAAIVLINPLSANTFRKGWLGSALWLRIRAPGISRAVYGALGRLVLPKAMGEQVLAFQFGAVGRDLKLHLDAEVGACFTRENQMRSLLGVLDDVMHYKVFDMLRPAADFPPLCTVWGLENRVLSAKAGRKLNHMLAPLREEWLEACGHLVMMERPDEVGGIIRGFFISQGVPSVGVHCHAGAAQISQGFVPQ
jgi:pimeloyl-ACP methyl ester carboxylesterase